MFRQALILAGGLGTRLRPIVADRPKPMAEFSGRPFLERQMAYLRAQGVREVVLCIGYLADEISNHFQDGAGCNLTIRYSRESEPLGTGGAIKLAEPLLDDVFFVLNGDTLVSCDLAELCKHHMKHQADVTVAVSQVQDSKDFGVVRIDAGNVINEFHEKEASRGPAYVNAGLYVLSANLLKDIPAVQPLSLEHDLLPTWLLGKKVVAFTQNVGFIDIGTPERYIFAARQWPT